jgi:hypothetical protein
MGVVQRESWKCDQTGKMGRGSIASSHRDLLVGVRISSSCTILSDPTYFLMHLIQY